MSDIVERLRQPWPPSNSEDPLMTEAADEIDRLRAALRGAEAWLQNWAVHVGRCEGGLRCTCGLTAIRFDTRAALGEKA